MLDYRRSIVWLAVVAGMVRLAAELSDLAEARP